VREALRRLPQLLALLAVVKLAATLAFSDRYGWHRDELYYLASGNHLAWGYVDYPPVTPALARLEEAVFGVSLVGLRLLPALAGAAIVVLAGLLARELGGARAAQVLAALLTLACPLFLGANTLFQTVTFEQLWVVLALLLVARLVRTGDPRWWLAVGLVLGLGLETKYTVLDIAAGLAAGVLLTGARRHLATPWPWLGLAVAALVAVPNLAWQVQHGWPTLEYLRNHQASNRRDYPPAVFLLEQTGQVGLELPVVLWGGWFLLRSPRYRLLGWTCVVALTALLILGGKPYYLGPIYPLLIAAGAAQVTAALPGRGWRAGIAAAAIGQAVLALPIVLPVLPAPAMAQLGLYRLRSDYADESGWDEYVTHVHAAWDSLPPADRARVVVVTANYGEAGALDALGPLPRVFSGHLTYWYWGPPPDADVMLAVGLDRGTLESSFGDVTGVGTITNGLGVRNEEYGRAIYVCREPRVPLSQQWPRFKAFR
jgi:hypothetical protein